MGGEAVALPRVVGPSAARGAVVGCRLDSLARVLSWLLPQPVTSTNVRDRAVGLGLLRLPPDGAAPRLPPEKASRLLLAGYRLPAVAEIGTPATARAHLAAGRHVSLMSNEGETGLACSVVAWEGAGGLMVVAARSWNDLPTTGARFFGGTRERDGSYHWDAADCDTDATGRILRLW
jgi:hypothetical protein